MIQNWIMNSPHHNRPPPRRIEHDLMEEYDDLGKKHEHEEIVSEDESDPEVEEEEAHEHEEIDSENEPDSEVEEEEEQMAYLGEEEVLVIREEQCNNIFYTRRNGHSLPTMQHGKKQVKLIPDGLMWIHRCKERFCGQRKSKLLPHADGPFQILKKGSVGTNDIADLRTNLFQQGGYNVPQHGVFGPRSSKKEESKFESPMVSSKGPKTSTRAKFITLDTYLDGKRICEGVWEFRGN